MVITPDFRRRRQPDRKIMHKTTSNQLTSEQYEDMLHIRMAIPEFKLLLAEAIPEDICGTTQIFIDYLMDLGFIYTHEIVVKNAVGKDEGGSARIIVYLNVDQNVYALVTDLYHTQSWIHFTSYFPNGERVVTSSQPGALLLEPTQRTDVLKDLTVQNAGSATVDAQWKKHRRLAASHFPNETGAIFKPEQHLAVERSFYLRYVQHLLTGNILQQSDTQTVRFTRSGARAYYSAITSKSAKRPKPQVEKWIGKRGKLPLRQSKKAQYAVLASGALVAMGLALVVKLDPKLPLVSSDADQTQTEVAVSSTDSALIENEGPGTEPVSPFTIVDRSNPADEGSPQQNSLKKDRQQLIIASTEDEMWRIAVENAEFFLLSNDGDPAPWIRTARKIAAGFKTNDSRLARTYFLSALMEPDYRIAEQQFNRALSIQTKTLGLYHAETAQTLEALAWIAEHNKESLDEAITHQRLAINIYRDIFGADAEDTRAAQWKLEYFEDRLAGLRPKADSNNRLLPALARFSR